LVGSAVEQAASLCGEEFDFKELFIKQEESQDEDSVSLAEVLELLLQKWPDGFTSVEVVKQINDDMLFSMNMSASDNSGLGLVLRDFLYPGASEELKISSRVVGTRLGKHLNNAVAAADGRSDLVLRVREDSHRNRTYSVERMPKTRQVDGFDGK
jgi:hypothetical protein